MLRWELLQILQCIVIDVAEKPRTWRGVVYLSPMDEMITSAAMKHPIKNTIISLCLLVGSHIGGVWFIGCGSN